jgi:hypothetical protein
MQPRYYCDTCDWEGEAPVLTERLGRGCGGVLWTMPCCPECGEIVSSTVRRKDGGEALA